MSAEIFCGTWSKPAGRRGENASYALADTFKRLQIELGRHRTGTPPRLSAKTIDFSKFQLVKPDEKPIPFSFMTDKIWLPVEKQVYLRDLIRIFKARLLASNLRWLHKCRGCQDYS